MAWSHRILEIDTRPAQVLIDDRFRPAAPVPELPRLAWFAVFCQQDAGDGFWNPQETASLDSIEKDLIGLCDQFGSGWAVYVMRIDTHGVREYYLYSGGNSALAQVLPRLQAAHPNYRMEFEETDDAAWNRYKEFLPRNEL